MMPMSIGMMIVAMVTGIVMYQYDLKFHRREPELPIAAMIAVVWSMENVDELVGGEVRSRMVAFDEGSVNLSFLDGQIGSLTFMP